MDISHLPKAKVLAALYNNSRPFGMGYLQAKDGDMSEEEAAELLKEQTSFDYLHGRLMKIDLSGDELDPWLYNRDLGEGAAERVIAELK